MTATLRVANAPCSWGVLEFDLQGQAAGYTQVLDEMAQTGYVGTELGDWGFMPTDPAKLRHEIAARKLSMLAAFVPVRLVDPSKHAAGEEVALRTARLLADSAGEACYIVLADDNGSDPTRTKNAGRIKPEMGLSQAQWQVYADGANKIARSVREKVGLRTVFHHHCAGYVETPDEIDTLLRMTDPAVLGLCYDTGHLMFGGGDPVKTLEKYYDRIWHVHFKDCHPGVAEESRKKGWDYFESIRHGIFCELGKGAVDFKGVYDVLKARGYSGWIVVEQDVLPGMGTPIDSARRNREYLRSIGL